MPEIPTAPSRGIEPRLGRFGGFLLLAALLHRSLHRRTGRVPQRRPARRPRAALPVADHDETL